jgi:hypothetical protein
MGPALVMSNNPWRLGRDERRSQTRAEKDANAQSTHRPRRRIQPRPRWPSIKRRARSTIAARGIICADPWWTRAPAAVACPSFCFRSATIRARSSAPCRLSSVSPRRQGGRNSRRQADSARRWRPCRPQSLRGEVHNRGPAIIIKRYET